MKMDSLIKNFTQAEFFSKVGNICNIANSATSTTDLLEDSLKQTVGLFGASRGSIFILNESGQELILESAQGMAKDEQATMVKKMGEGIIGHVAEIKKPIFVEDIDKDSRFSKYKSNKNYLTPSFICAPLMIKDTLVGVINIADKHSGSHFKENDLQLLDFLSSQIALNYRRIELYNKFKSILKETKDLKDKLGQTDEEKKILEHKIEIQERLATIGKLAGGIAHEFNNPLDGVIRYTNLSLDHAGDDEILRNYLLEIKNGLNRMAKIVKNLLACSRSEKTSNQKVSITQAIENTLTGKIVDIQGKKIKIRKQVQNDIPLLQDFGIERVVSNIITNAIDAVEEKGEIHINAALTQNAVTVEITDNGNGIPEENIAKIFEPFFTTKDIEKGCGLGLTIASEIIKIYRGKIDINSKPGQGTTFTITIPVE